MISTSTTSPPSWVAGSPGDKNHRRSESPASVDMALDAIQANPWERRVAHLISKVDGPRSALRVVASFRDAPITANCPT